MAISFVLAKAISRGNGQSVVASVAYQTRSKLQDERYSKVHNYTTRPGLISQGLQCPEGVTMSREKLWNLVEKTENRKDARLAKHFIIALPHEFSDELNTQVTKAIAEQLSHGNRFADWAVHEPDARGNQKNKHAHVTVTERNWDYETKEFSKTKNREWNTEEYLQKQKIAIAEICNIELQKLGIKLIDPRRYIEKLEAGLDVSEPQKHQGVKKTNYERNKVEKLERLQKEITKLEALGYGDDIGRSDGLDRPLDRRSDSIEKEHGAELGSNSETRKPSGRGRGGRSGRGEGFGIGD